MLETNKQLLGLLLINKYENDKSKYYELYNGLVFDLATSRPEIMRLFKCTDDMYISACQASVECDCRHTQVANIMGATYLSLKSGVDLKACATLGVLAATETFALKKLKIRNTPELHSAMRAYVQNAKTPSPDIIGFDEKFVEAREVYSDMCIEGYRMLIQSYLSDNDYLDIKEENAKLKAKLAKPKVVEKIVKVIDEEKTNELLDHIADLEYRLENYKAILCDRGRTVEDVEEELEHTELITDDIDLSEYKIMVVTSKQHSNAFQYSYVDIDAHQSIDRLSAADVVILDTAHISHGCYWKVKDHCIAKGIKYLHYGKRDADKLDKLIKFTLGGK